MSSEPSAKTEVCGAFQAQAWRKTLCVNCFHTLDEHGGTGGTPAVTTDSKTTKPTEGKSSPKTQSKIQPKTPESPGTPKTGTKSPLAQATTGKSSPLSNVKNGDKPAVKAATQDVSKTAKVDAKKQPPSVAAKHPPEPPGRKTTPSHTQQTTPPDGGKSPAAVTKVANFGKVATGVGDPLRKQNGADGKTKTTPGIGKSDTSITTSDKVSPVLSNKSQKPAPDDHKSSSKQQFTGPVDKKPALNLDKSTKPSRAEDKQKQPEDETKSKPSKIFGLMKSFGSADDTSSDVRGSVKDKARSEKNETKPETDVSKFHLKDSQISPKGSSSEQKQSSNSIKPSAITSNTPPLARANVLTDTSKGKQAEVTSRGKQGLGDGSKDRQEKSSNHLDSVTTRGGKDTAQTVDSSKGKTFAPSSLNSASKGKDSNVSTKDTIFSKHSDSSTKSSEVSSHKTDELLKSKELELAKLTTKLKEMEEKCRKLTEDNAALKKMAYDSKKSDVEKSLSSCKSQLATMEAKCAKLQGDNQELQNKLKMKDVQSNKDKPDSKAVSQLERDLETSDAECQELKSENLELRKELSNLKVEMEEMYDTFKENEMDEFRELQKELDLASKNCRILQFKLRKSERRNEQIEADKHGYEDKLRSLQSQFTSDDARDHIRALEEDLKMAKEVSVRLNDEIDMMEDKKCKVEDENRQLTEILEQADKKQFRMEMDIDRLKDQIADLKQKVPRSQTEQDTRDRRSLLGRIGKQSSGDQEMSQMTRDLFDSVERENDLTEQLKFTEEETKMMRKKLHELEEENERLNVQLKKLSKGSSKCSKKESSDKPKIIVTDPNDSDSSMTDDTDTEDELNIVEVKLQLGLLEQELSVSHRKITDVEQINENLQTQIKVLNEQLAHREQLLSVVPTPPSPNSYYLDKIKEMTIECDDLRWKIIEKDRAIERLSTQAQAKAREGKLKKARSLDSEPHIAQIADLRRQIDIVSHEAELFKDRLASSSAEAEKLAEENARLRLLQRVPSIQADDAAIENIELRDKGKRLEDENKNLQEKIKVLTDNLQTLTRTPRSPTTENPPSPSIADGIYGSRDLQKQLERILEENKSLREKMADLKQQQIKAQVDSSSKTKDESTMDKTVAADTTAASDSRDHLMETILDLEDEIESIKSKLRDRESENIRLEVQVTTLQEELEELKDESQNTELELMREIEMIHDKNSVLTNLLDIVNERAETAEKELEQQYQHHSSPSERSASAVSALSGASVGSDDVFLVPPSLPSLGGDKSMVVNRDWEGQFKKRISSLERLLAEERQKVHTVEKKLRLADPDMHTSGMSDDVKLHLREKELLQDELLDHQKNMRIATDQIKGFKERLSIMEEENLRLRMDYGKLCDELDQKISEHEKTPENELEPSSANSLSASPGPRPRSPIADTADIGRLKEQCAKFKLKAEELEYKVEELNEIWRSKSAVLEQSKKDLENEIASQGTEMAVMKQTLETLKKDLCEKEKKITEQEAEISEKNSALNRREDFLHEQDDVIRQRDTDFQTLLNQVSQREETIKNLRENVRTRDERLKEKDGYIEKLNKNLEERQKETVTLQDEIKDTMASVKEKEVIIAILQQQISESCIRDTGSETDIEKENARLKQALRSSQSELQKSRDEKDRLLGELEKSRKALNEAMLLWEKNRSGLQTDLNILMEKLRLYEINTTMDRNDIILNLKADTERYYKEKEKLACEIHNIRTEHDVDNSALKEQVVSLQVELTEKCQQLKEEVEIGTRLQQEVDRLTAQAEMAYRLQQEEKILRAEYLAMKVRYETRIDKMSRDYSRALVTVESLEKERELDKEIIKAAQKGMLQLKDSYTQDLIKWEDEKQRLEKHGKEIEDSRELAREMKRKIQEFKEKVMEQDNLRSELINRCATERASGEIERANLQSKINQLQEQLTLTTQVQSKVRDKQSSMETTWEKERSEQKRLLTEAHSLALDLQQQIKARDAEFSTNRRDLLKQVDLERQNYERERKVKEKALADLEVLGKKFVALQLRFKELQERSERDQEIWLREKNDLRRRIMETKLAHTRDTKRIDDILSSLIKLREIGALIAADEQETASSKGNQSRDLHQNILKYIKESVAEITFAADQLANETSSPGEDKNKFRRSLSSSELNLLKEQLSAENSGSSSNPNTLAVQRSIQRSITYDSSVPLTSAAILPPSPSPRLSDRPPSYSSGSRSAQSSRAQTPDSLDRGSFSHLQSSPFQQPSSLTIPSTRLSRSTDIIDDPSSRNNNRPKTLIKSVSMDTPSSSAMSGTVPSNKSVSVTTTPTFPTSESFTSGYNDRSRSDDTILSPAPSNFNRLTPRSARKKFFEQQSPASPGFGYLSWPDRKSAAHHQHQSSLPVTQRQMSEIAQPATFAVPAMRTSASMDEKMHYQMNIPSEESLLKPKTLPEERERGTSPGPKTAKEKRKFFKKSSSLDSTVGSSILKIGMQAIPPAAPTGFAPTDIFSTIKGKLKGKKSKETLKTTDPGLLDESISNSESTGDIDKPPASFQKESSPRPPSTPTTPQTSSKNTTDDERASAAERGSRSAAPPGVDAKRWRSKSAERPQRVAKPIMVHSDVITPMQVWQFSETAV